MKLKCSTELQEKKVKEMKLCISKCTIIQSSIGNLKHVAQVFMQKPYTLIVLQEGAFIVARIPIFPNRKDRLCTLNIFFHVFGRITRHVKEIDTVKELA